METDPQFKKYKDSLSKDEQGSLGNQWCKYMEASNAWFKLLAFYKSETMEGIQAFVGGEIFEEEESKHQHTWQGTKGKLYKTITHFSPFNPLVFKGFGTGEMAIASPMLEEDGADSNKTRDQGNWMSLAMKGLSNQFMELNYTKQPTVVEVQLYVNMLNEKLETMHVDLNEGFRRQTKREENDAHIITLNDESLGNRINYREERTNHISKINDAIENTEDPEDKNQRPRR